MACVSSCRGLFIGPSSEVSFVEQDVRILSARYPVDTVWRKDHPTRKHLLKAIRSRLSNNRYSFLLVWFAEPYDTASILLLGRRYGIPSALVVGGYEVTSLPEIEYGGQRRLRDRVRVRIALQLASLILPTSELLAAEVRSLGRSRNVEVIHPGIDCELFRPSGTSKESLVVTVATVSESTVRLKGLDVFARASARVPGATFAILGPCEDDSLLTRLKSMGGGNLTIRGQKLSATEICHWYQRATVYAQLSARESFGIAMAEAMACECRPVSTSRGSLKEVGGGVSSYVPFGDVEKAADAIRTALVEGRSIEARQRVKDLYSLEKRVQALPRAVGRISR